MPLGPPPHASAERTPAVDSLHPRQHAEQRFHWLNEWTLSIKKAVLLTVISSLCSKLLGSDTTEPLRLQMERFVADFDPLVALEAEYAAVVARTRPTDGNHLNHEPEPVEEVEKSEQEPSESDEDNDDDAVQYAPLPADSDDDDNDSPTDEESEEAVTTPPLPSPAPPTPMDESTKHTIMSTMQSLHLRPPPWAQEGAIPDDELLELVQRRLHVTALSEKSQ